MILPPQHSNPKSDTVRFNSAEQDVINQIQSEQLTLVRVALDEVTEEWQQPIRLSDWSSTLESEIYRSLW